MVPAELQALADDIKAHGLREKIKLWEVDDTRADAPAATWYYLIDGRNRLDALALLGQTPWAGIETGDVCNADFFEVLEFTDNDAVSTYVAQVNVFRRNLSSDQTADYTRRLLGDPEDIAIAKKAGLKPSQVAQVRKLLGEVAAAAAEPEAPRDDDPPSKSKGKDKGKKGLAAVAEAVDTVSVDAAQGMF